MLIDNEDKGWCRSQTFGIMAQISAITEVEQKSTTIELEVVVNQFPMVFMEPKDLTPTHVQ